LTGNASLLNSKNLGILTSVSGAAASTEEQAKVTASYEGFDFGSVWKMHPTSGLPVLQFQ
jgi:hypothetical protein